MGHTIKRCQKPVEEGKNGGFGGGFEGYTSQGGVDNGGWGVDSGAQNTNNAAGWMDTGDNATPGASW